MPKFNVKPSIGSEVATHPDRTVNYEGGLAFKTDPKTELTLRALTYLVGEPKFYTPNADDEMSTLRELIARVSESDPEYLMKLANYARNTMYLRSAPIFLLVESAQYNGVKPFIKTYTPTILKRADELTEVIAYFISKNGEIGASGKASLPNSLKNGIAESFHNFDTYQYAKYDRDGTVKLRDVLRLVHPKPRDEEESQRFKQIRDRSLPIAETWETVISNNGSNKESWESVIPKMGYMAKLRNLRNFLKHGVTLELVIRHLTNEKAVKYSRQFPFRFYSAYKIIENESEGDPFNRNTLLGAIEKALELSVNNLPKLGGRTFVTSDNSGSMESSISQRSTITYKDIANIMGALGHRISDQALASVFGTNFEVVQMNGSDSVMSNTAKMSVAGNRVGGSTNAFLSINYLLQKQISVDRILFFSDMQCYSTGGGNRWGYFSGRGESLAEQLKTYKRTINPKVKLYSFDLTGYGSVQFPQDESNVVLLSGWSSRVLNFISKYEHFGTNLIQEINSYTPE